MHFSERKDVIQLGDWMEMMILEIYSEPSNCFSDTFENLQFVYTAAISELVRQVMMQCWQRGALIQRVWEAMMATN